MLACYSQLMGPVYYVVQPWPQTLPDPLIKHPYLRLSMVVFNVMLTRLASSATGVKVYSPEGNFFTAN